MEIYLALRPAISPIYLRSLGSSEKYFVKFILTFLFSIQASLGSSPPASKFNSDIAVLNPNVSPGRFIFAAGTYEDIRIDQDLDGNIDYWRIRHGSLSIEISFSGKEVKTYSIKKISSKNVTEIVYSRVGSTLALTKALTRTPKEMFFSEKGVCEDTYTDLKKQISELGKIESLSRSEIIKSYLDPKCEELLGPAYTDLGLAIMSKINDKDSISRCLSNKELLKYFPDTADTKLAISIFAARHDLQRAHLNKDPKSNSPLIKCEEKDHEKNQLTYSTLENGTIKIGVPSSNANPKIEMHKLDHEFLHRSGIESEEAVNMITDACSRLSSEKKDERVVASAPSRFVNASVADNGIQTVSETEVANIPTPLTKPADITAGQTNKNPGTETAAVSAGKSASSEKYQGAVNAAAGSTANIPKTLTVAQTNIPSSDSLSQTIYSNPQKTPSGIETAYKNSVAQSGNVFKTANNLVGSMNTQAAATTLAAGTAQAREIASATTAQIANVGGAEVARNAALAGVTSRNIIKSNETVVEQITLDGPNTRAAANTTDTNPQLNRNIASVPTNGGVTNSAQPTATATQSSSPAAESSFSGATVNPTTSSSAATNSLGAGQNNIQRQPANANRGPVSRSGEVGSATREQMINNISSDYTETKRRLSDPSYRQQLSSENITIIDSRGASYGAARGQAIFLERSNQFVRQK